jgi:hypothetical protein
MLDALHRQHAEVAGDFLQRAHLLRDAASELAWKLYSKCSPHRDTGLIIKTASSGVVSGGSVLKKMRQLVLPAEIEVPGPLRQTPLKQGRVQ